MPQPAPVFNPKLTSALYGFIISEDHIRQFPLYSEVFMFDPKTDRFPYPEDTDRHYLIVKKNDGTVFDKNYPYVDRSKGFLFRQNLVRAGLMTVVALAAKVRLGLRFEGRENLKKHAEEIRRGVISCSNHVHMWDYISVNLGIRPNRPHVLSWAPNISGENGFLIRMVGGIPLPENDLRASAVCYKAIGDMLDAGGWLHVYSEGSMWEYYAPIRPFKRGAAYFACKYDKPIVPLAFSYREPGIIRKKLFRQIALLTLHIGEPIYADPSLSGEERENDLTKRSHDAVCRLAGIDPEENIYPPIFDGSKRIDYYTDAYGVGYKGSY